MIAMPRIVPHENGKLYRSHDGAFLNPIALLFDDAAFEMTGNLDPGSTLQGSWETMAPPIPVQTAKLRIRIAASQLTGKAPAETTTKQLIAAQEIQTAVIGAARNELTDSRRNDPVAVYEKTTGLMPVLTHSVPNLQTAKRTQNTVFGQPLDIKFRADGKGPDGCVLRIKSPGLLGSTQNLSFTVTLEKDEKHIKHETNEIQYDLFAEGISVTAVQDFLHNLATLSFET